MRVQFFDRQHFENPRDGAQLDGVNALRDALRSSRDRPPFFAELIGSGESKLLLGLGATTGCAQFSTRDGAPPYLLAVSTDRHDDREEMEFLIGGTASPVPARYLLSSQQLEDIAVEFLETGERPTCIDWEEI